MFFYFRTWYIIDKNVLLIQFTYYASILKPFNPGVEPLLVLCGCSESVDLIPKSDHSNEIYFSVILFTMLHKVALTFESVDKILKCDHSNESY